MFGSTLSGRPVKLCNEISQLQYVIQFDNIQLNKPTQYLTIFILPDVQFDPNYTALIYFQYKLLNDPSPNGQTEFKLLGGLSQTKQSSIFKVSLGTFYTPDDKTSNDVDMDADDFTGGYRPSFTSDLSLVIGISVEPNAQANAALSELKKSSPSKPTPPHQAGQTTNNVPKKPAPVPAESVDIEVLSNNIITNAYNFLSSFVDSNNKVYIARFDDWWAKFKHKMANDEKFRQRMTR
ncbi:unnamed protein product [Ambrosiozyma monospora]|uniref:Unnamed protein product n=1 Tax=Ambrosiozyma monospora TaxID=43982 RepID=A0A9W6YS31_AMBMO|nr:unnamed protein product [Ambrosiozyma monospora]